MATVDAGPDYGVCESATNYTTELNPSEGIQLCVRTSEHRLAWVKILNLQGPYYSRTEIDLDVTVWDPPRRK